MILDFMKKHKNIVFLVNFVLLCVTIIVTVAEGKFEPIFVCLFIAGMVLLGGGIYLYCRYIAKGEFLPGYLSDFKTVLTLNFEIGIISNQLLVIKYFIMFIGGARHGENEILMLAIPFSLWAIVWTEKFNISGRLFK